MEKMIDFSVLEGMNIPKIEISEKDQFSLEEAGIQEAKEAAIETVEGIENFGKKKETKKEDTEENESNEDENSEESEENNRTSTSDEAEESAVKLISSWAKDNQLIDFDPEKFEDTEEWLQNQFATKVKTEIEKGVQEELSKYPDEIKELAENYKKGVPFDELLYSKSREIEYSGIKEDQIEKDKDLQKKLVSEWIQISDPDATDEEIEKKIQKLDDAVLLEDEAKTAHKKLQKYEVKYQEELKTQAQKAEEARKTSFENRIKEIEKDFLSTEEPFKGIKDTPEQRKKIFEAYTKQDTKGKTALMKAIESDPKAWYKITKLMVEMKGDFESIKKDFQTEATKKIKETVSSGGGNSSARGITDMDFKKLQKVFKKRF